MRIAYQILALVSHPGRLLAWVTPVLLGLVSPVLPVWHEANEARACGHEAVASRHESPGCALAVQNSDGAEHSHQDGASDEEPTPPHHDHDPLTCSTCWELTLARSVVAHASVSLACIGLCPPLRVKPTPAPSLARIALPVGAIRGPPAA